MHVDRAGVKERSPFNALRRQLPLLTVVVASGAAMTLVGVQQRVPVGDLTRDLAATTESAWYLGAVSSVGAVGWAVAAAVTAFVAAFVVIEHGWGRSAASLAAVSGLSALLGLDDILLLHDDVLLRLLGSELPVYGTYAVLGVWWIGYSYSLIDPSERPALWVSLGCFAASVVIDVTWRSGSELRIFAEDGLKFVGIWVWATFLALHSMRVLRDSG